MEVADAFLKSLCRSFVPKIAPLQVELISFRVGGVALDESPFVFARKSQLQLLGNFARNSLFDSDYI